MKKWNVRQWRMNNAGALLTRALPIHLFRHFCCRMYHFATMVSITESQTERQTDDSMMPIGLERYQERHPISNTQ